MDEPIKPGAMPSHWAASDRGSWIAAAGLIVAGIAALFVLASLEARWLDGQPWSRAIWTAGYEVNAEDARTAWSRELSLEQSVGDSPIAVLVQDDLIRQARSQAVRTAPKADAGANPFDTSSMLDLDYFPRARLVMLDLAAAELEPVLASGRLPEPGRREILAGALLSDRDLVLDGETFTVTGRLRPQAAGFGKAYVMPSDPALERFFAEESGGVRGSMLSDASGRMEALVPELFDESEEKPKVFGGPVQTRLYIAWGVWFSLLLVAVGASLAFMALYRLLSRSSVPVLSHAMQEAVLRPRLLLSLHMVFFGGFFGAMALGLQDAEFNHFFMEFASHQFTDGDLKYVGDAYQSGNIPRAAHATVHNNFVVQTLYMSTGLSLIPPFVLGLLKIMASFVVVGFAMAPLWTETAAGMTYHAITLALELPPYILAGFGIAVWAHCAWRFLWSPVRVFYLGDKASAEPIIADAARQLPRGLIVLAGCTLLSGVFLYVAAWYEAVTLILLR